MLVETRPIPATSTIPPAAKLVTFININHPNYDCSQFANSKPINKIKMTVVCGRWMVAAVSSL